MIFFWNYIFWGQAFAQEALPKGFRTPCFDGWAECFENEEVYGSRFLYDDNQLKHDVRSRVSFFDFTVIEKGATMSVFPPIETIEKKRPVIAKKKTSSNTVKTSSNTVRKKPPVEKTVPDDEVKLEEWQCPPIDELEDAALLGVLSKKNINCVEENLHKQPLMTKKVQLSKILITNMQKSKAFDKWENLVLRHLTKFDRSDANMSLGFAIYLFNKKKYIDSIKWCDNALEQSHTFAKGADTKDKKYKIYKIRAMSAHSLWKKYAEELVKYRDDYNRERIEKKIRTYKAKTKNFSREWLDYARASSNLTSQPLKLCIAASNRDFCK